MRISGCFMGGGLGGKAVSCRLAATIMMAIRAIGLRLAPIGLSRRLISRVLRCLAPSVIFSRATRLDGVVYNAGANGCDECRG